MTHMKTRGIVAVRAQGGDVKSYLENLNADFEAFKDAHKAELKETQAAVDQANSTLAAMSLNGTGAQAAHRLSPQAAADFTSFLRSGAMSDGMKPQAAMQSGNQSDGGASVPGQISQLILDQMVDVNPLRGLASVETATSGDYSKIVGLRGASSGWAAETDPRSITSTPSMGEIKPPMGELFVYAESTSWILEDSQFDLEAWLNDNIADEFALQEAGAFVNGDGMNKPAGFLTAPQSADDDDIRPFGTLQTVAAQSAAAIEIDDLVNLMTTLRTPYRVRNECAWLMSRTTAAAIRRLKDADGRPLWIESVSADAPPTLLGYPVAEAEDMPSVGANNISVAFGNWPRGYLIVDRTGMRTLRDPYTRPGWVRFYVHHRVGGQVMDSNAIKLLIHPAA
ncbi:MAG: phage major capsid protein [Roseovarius sp.]|nr:phage major capsid protein [Roseovarius sp.]